MEDDPVVKPSPRQLNQVLACLPTPPSQFGSKSRIPETDPWCMIPIQFKLEFSKIVTDEVHRNIRLPNQMRAIIQRVTSASVSVEGKVISEISKGLLVLVGIAKDDTTEDAVNISRKILNQRVFDDDTGKMWKSSVMDIKGEVLCVSQFTLYGNTSKGNKPDFHNAMGATSSYDFYRAFLEILRSSYEPNKVKDGKFGAMMCVSLCNEGPVTLSLDSRKFTYSNASSTTLVATAGTE